VLTQRQNSALVPHYRELYMTEHIVAVFETETAAAAATESLLRAGIPSSAIRQYAGTEASRTALPTDQTSTHTSGGGFWSWLFGEESSSHTARPAYADDLYDRRSSAGQVVVSVTVDEDSKIHEVIAALEAHNPVDIDERSDEVDEVMDRSSIAPMPSSSTTRHDFSSGDVVQAGMTDTAPTREQAGPRGAPLSTEPAAGLGRSSTVPGHRSGQDVGEGEQVLPLSEERLDVGKRTVDRGTTRVRRYVVEKPVEENVTLRSERVTVERRQPIGTTAAPGIGAFEERVVEVRETAEEPVVAKTARVAEEVVVGREATERTETVRDTVRREEVEVSDNTGVKR
jgi:uncharacterized protein (TIGR02271 family)